jgi:hypothetical protein
MLYFPQHWRLLGLFTHDEGLADGLDCTELGLEDDLGWHCFAPDWQIAAALAPATLRAKPIKNFKRIQNSKKNTANLN